MLFEIALPGTNFLDRQGVALESLGERQGAATQSLKHRSFPPDRPPPVLSAGSSVSPRLRMSRNERETGLKLDEVYA